MYNTEGLAPTDFRCALKFGGNVDSALGSGTVEEYTFRDPYCLRPQGEGTHLRPSGRPIALVAYVGI